MPGSVGGACGGSSGCGHQGIGWRLSPLDLGKGREEEVERGGGGRRGNQYRHIKFKAWRVI